MNQLQYAMRYEARQTALSDPINERAQSQERAIAAFQATLTVYTPEAFPTEWAAAQINLGTTYSERILGERAGNLEQAITAYQAALTIYTRDTFPSDWAMIQNNLSKVYSERILGDHSENVEAAIVAGQAALTVRTIERSPFEWAMTQTNLGVAYCARILGEPTENLRQGIAAFENALTVFTRETFPNEWASLWNNLGFAFSAKILQGRTKDLEHAVDAFNRALTIRRRESSPILWAMTTNNLGSALCDLAKQRTGMTKVALLEKAIACYESALSEQSREVAPLDWAMTSSNLGAALTILGEDQSGPSRNRTLEKAIGCCNDALKEYQREIVPLNWAMAQCNLGGALSAMAEGLSGETQAHLLQAALAAYREVLEVYSPHVYPSNYRGLAHALARIYLFQAAHIENLSLIDTLDQAWSVIASAVAAADLLELRAPSLTFRQQEWLENASLFNLAGCIAARRGRLGEAVALIERGRARWLAEAAGRRNADLSLLTNEDRDGYLHAVEAVQAMEAQGRQGDDPLALVEAAREANEQLAAVVAQLRNKYPGFLSERNASIPTLTAALQQGEALAYLIPQETGTLVLVIPHEGVPRMKWLADLTAHDVFTLTSKRGIEDESQSGFVPAALGWLRRDRGALALALDELLPQLGDRLMQHVVKLARYAGCHRVVLVTSWYLSLLPLHAATYAPLDGEPETAPDGRRYACDDLAITYAPSGLTLLDARRTAMRQRRAGKARRLFIAGNPQLTPEGQPWTPETPHYLRYAEWEARRVSEIATRRAAPLDSDLALNEQATWKRVVEGLGEADAAHLALHATFNFDDPQQSAFLVAFQAKLLLRDLLDPRLTNLARLRLVVLSACQSALSDVSHQSEEAVGLFGALLAGGVPEVIGTLWSVNDLATAALMESFAQRYFTQGRTAGDALREATRDLRGVRDAPDATHLATSPATFPATSTSALRRWGELAERDPEAVDATRLLDDKGLAEAGEVVRRFADGQSKRAIPRDHPVYWAAFVFHGASLPLDSDIPAEPAESANDLIAAPVQPLAPPQSALASDEPRDAENRTADYFPAVEGVCPRCYAQDFVSTHDDLGRELRQCLSCQQVYRVSAPMPDPPQ